MKRLLTVTALTLFFFGPQICSHAIAQQEAAAQKKPSDRWESEIVVIEENIRSGKSPRNEILFVGSSSIRLWELQKSFPELKTANHGFGGSFLSDSVELFDRIVVPVSPSVIVVYAGDNDIASKKTPETIHQDFRDFVSLVRDKLPECRKVIYICIKPSVLRWSLADNIQKTNSLIEATCANDPQLEFLDIWTPMLRADGTPNADLLLLDGLHMNENGYRVWADALRPHLTPPAEQSSR